MMTENEIVTHLKGILNGTHNAIYIGATLVIPEKNTEKLCFFNIASKRHSLVICKLLAEIYLMYKTPSNTYWTLAKDLLDEYNKFIEKEI